MEWPLHAKGRFERASFVRHVAISFAAVAAWLFPEQVRASNPTLWIIGVTVVANLALTVVADRRAWTRVSLVASPLLGLAGWTMLVHVTGGVSSPFVPGFWLEILLSTWTGSPLATLCVTAAATLGLWAQQAAIGPGLPIRSLLFQTAFLAAMGGVTLLLNRQWRRTQGESARRQAALMERLSALEREMDVLRAGGRSAESVARLAHALKNAIHSLRGFASLVDAAGSRSEAFDGLRAAIDRIDEIARVTLDGDPASRAAIVTGAQMRGVIEEAIAQVSIGYPGIAWRTSVAGTLPQVQADRAMLREALVDLARNAAEAMNGAGEIVVETMASAEKVEIRIRDHGAGLAGEALRRAGTPGFTTKPGGSGFGLFLTRRFVESHGGRLSVGAARGGGAVISLALQPHGGGRP